jgi:hypothetical protein
MCRLCRSCRLCRAPSPFLTARQSWGGLTRQLNPGRTNLVPASSHKLLAADDSSMNTSDPQFFVDTVAQHVDRLLLRHPARTALKIEPGDFDTDGLVGVGNREYELCRHNFAGQVRTKGLRDRNLLSLDDEVNAIAYGIADFFLSQQDLDDLIFARLPSWSVICEHSFVCLNVRLHPGRPHTDYVIEGAFGTPRGQRQQRFSMVGWYMVEA